ncbi:MAG: M23 family metallopeptidase [Hahellaceae bacterium]|nr:M23 family metallopeptidase [Hahellaceae bacterium]
MCVRKNFLARTVAGSLLLAWQMAAQASCPIELRGKLIQGALIVGKVMTESSVSLNNRSIPVAKDGTLVFAFDRDEPLSATLIVTPRGQSPCVQTLSLTAREYQIQRVEGISKKVMKPEALDYERIAQETALVKAARAKRSDREDFLTGFSIPVDGPVTGVYGSQRFYNGKPGRPHYGVDYAAPIGTPVKAPAPGKVVLVHPEMFYSGGTLIVDHGMGVFSTFIHLSKVLVKEGDEISPGDVIAEVGKTGRATGAHLDWRINWLDVRVDPQQVLSDFGVAGTVAE